MDPIYLDHAATTPLRPEVRAAMEPYLSRLFGNPSSPHRWGREAATALAEARAVCAEALGACFEEVYFVRGGTESVHLAVLGRAMHLRGEGEAPTVAVSAIEHSAVLGAAEVATAGGAGRLEKIPVFEDGSVDLDHLDRSLRVGSALVSLMWVNNETGILLPLSQVAERCRAAGATLHTDAVQAVGKVSVGVEAFPVDLLTASAHKLGGPKGTGLLFCRKGTNLSPLLRGGAQERGVRPGTEDVAGAVGMATALRLAILEREGEASRLEALRRRLEAELESLVEGIRVNAGRAPRAPHITSVGIEGVDGPSLLMALDLEGVAASGGAACRSGAPGPSHVIAALYGPDDPYATVRFSLGAGTTDEDVTRAAQITAQVVERLRVLGEGV